MDYENLKHIESSFGSRILRADMTTDLSETNQPVVVDGAISAKDETKPAFFLILDEKSMMLTVKKEGIDQPEIKINAGLITDEKATSIAVATSALRI